MTSHMPRILTAFGMIGLLALSACNPSSVPGDGNAAVPSAVDRESSISPVARESGEVLESKQADLPELPLGAGPIDPHPPEELTPTPSGLYYRILRKSHERKPMESDRVVLDYEGWLETGEGFDSSYERHELLETVVGNLIPGLTEGLQLIGAGGMIELEIPSELAYGEEGMPGDYPVPPNATVHFVVELKEIR
jgi:FKBP-type peptidyl-prolyl cis-trans isomerase FkpA